MRKQIYKNYLNSSKWKEFASVIRHERGNRCEYCQKSDTLHCHHMTYERLGNELKSDILVLCKGCHERYHDQFPSKIMPNMPIEQIRKHVFETLSKLPKKKKQKKQKIVNEIIDKKPLSEYAKSVIGYGPEPTVRVKQSVRQKPPPSDPNDCDRSNFLKRRSKKRQERAMKRKAKKIRNKP